MCLFLREILTQYWSPTPTKHKGLCRAKATTAAGVTGGASYLLFCEGLGVEQTTGKSEKHHPTQHLFLAVSRHYQLHKTTVHSKKNIANLSSRPCWSQPNWFLWFRSQCSPKNLDLLHFWRWLGVGIQRQMLQAYLKWLCHQKMVHRSVM